MTPNEIEYFLTEGKVKEGDFIRMYRANNGTITMRYKGKLRDNSIAGIDVKSNSIVLVKFGQITALTKLSDDQVVQFLDIVTKPK